MKEYFVHPSSEIEKGVKIGPDTKIWHFCHIMKGAKIGKGCSVGQNVFVGSGVKIRNYIKS